jgi:hypothetical protein
MNHCGRGIVRTGWPQLRGAEPLPGSVLEFADLVEESHSGGPSVPLACIVSLTVPTPSVQSKVRSVSMGGVCTLIPTARSWHGHGTMARRPKNERSV